MPAVSKKQQRFFGIVRAIQKGEMAPTTPETAKAAKDMKKGDVKDFASTKHKKLPEKIVKKEETELDEYYGMPGGMGSSRSKGVRDNEKYQKSKDRVDSLLAAVRRGREKRKKMKEETDYKSRDKILKRAKPLHKHLFKNLHKKDTSGDVNEGSNPRIPRKKGQPANSKKHSDLYTDENPKGTIHGLGFKDVATAKASVSKIRNSSRSHAHKIQAAVAMEQRAREMGKTSEAAVYRKFINTMKKKTKKMNEGYTADNFNKLKEKIGSAKKHRKPAVDEMFTIDPKSHKQQQRAKKIRDRTKTGDEGSEIAKKKVKGPALFGEGKWSDKYKKSIDCNNPKGFSQRAHCQGKRKVSEGYTSADNAERIKRDDADKKRFAKADARMKFGKFADRAKEAKDRLRPGEVKRYDKKLGRYVSNKE